MTDNKKVELKIHTPFIKLDQLIKFAGITPTGGQAKEIIADGLCRVKGEVCTQRGKKIYSEDEVEVGDMLFMVTSDYSPHENG